MKHNEEMLDVLRRGITSADAPPQITKELAETLVGFCKDYAELMSLEMVRQLDQFRWRSIHEEPEVGQTIECLLHDGCEVEICLYTKHVDMEMFQAWRPFKGMGDD